MDHHRKTKVVSGYTTLKAAQRAAQQGREKREGEQDPAPASKDVATTPKQIGAHIGHTAMPTQLDIVCYACSYEFKMAGRAPSTHCPKCRAMVDLSDYTIDSTWTESVRTGGKIYITADGVLISGDLVGGDICLEGNLKGGHLHATRELQLGPGATFTASRVSAQNLNILPGADIFFPGTIEYKNVLVAGKLKANLNASGLVKILCGAEFSGTLQANHLEVQEGGGLKAKLMVRDVPDEGEDEQLVLLKKPA
jgi:cytoskeletal protein CcmA (bactofilin family)